MFKIIDVCGRIHDAYGAFVDEDGVVQFILCDSSGIFYKTDSIAGYYELYREDVIDINKPLKTNKAVESARRYEAMAGDFSKDGRDLKLQTEKEFNEAMAELTDDFQR